MKFQSDNNGYITGLRFYKYSQNTGTHVGNLWTAGGTLLGSVTFTGETASGWQQANFASPIAITANTTYVASYFTPTGYYAATLNGFANQVTNTPLRALSNAAAPNNGVYRYGATSGFPTATYQAANYWVDVVFSTTVGPDTTPPTVTAVTPTANATGVSPSTTVTATFSEPMNAATITTATVLLRNTATSAAVTGTVSYNSGTATFTPSAPLANSTGYTATIKGGSAGVKDVAGNALASDYIWAFTTAGATTCPCSIWTLSTTPGPLINDAGAVELGMKFQSDNSGYITGLRFYKYAQNTGTHVGNLWTTGGTLLGSVTFTGETASGWQQANFASPIAITANTTYVASYFTPTGFYAGTSNGFANQVTSTPLRALSNAAAPNNGVYRYGATSGFPTSTYQAANYWVDVVFSTTVGPDTTPPTVTAVTPTANATGVSPSTTVTATFSEPMNAATITTATVLLRNTATSAAVTGTVSYNSGTATFTPSAPLANSTGYTATIKGGSAGVKDVAGNALASDYIWAFTTAAATTCPCSIWTLSTTPGPLINDAGAVELGMKFQSDNSGYITGLRFYKYAQNTGTHVGNLWTTGGTLLGSVTFTGETASGWQQANFASPIAITANTTYVASYFTPTGFYAGTSNGFANQVTSTPLRALSNAAAPNNGVYRYGGTSGFPTSTYQAANYWVDVVFSTTVGPDTTPPTVTAVTPTANSVGVSPSTTVTATFSEPMNAATFTTATVLLRNTATSAAVTGTVSYNSGTATFTPGAPLANSTGYTATIKGGSAGVKDVAGNALASDYIWAFTTGGPAISPTTGAGGPILVVATPGNAFNRYYAEILRAEGLNGFAVADLSTVTSTLLANYDVVILAEQTLSTAQVTTFTNWVQSGGNLIAMRPDKKLASLLGLVDDNATLSNAYLVVNASQAPGAGIVSQSMQFHGTADAYILAGATAVATLYSDATHATAYPAVTLKPGSSGAGGAAAFTYDLARSIVYTRQGNPAWSGLDRDGLAPIRSDDLFYGAASPDWVDLSKVAIPQADEQQRLLANLILTMNSARKPLPRFWYFPRGLKAAVVMTGDDHANNGTAGRFDIYNGNSAPGCNPSNWECVRATSYIFSSTPITSNQVATYISQGFEIGVHLWSSGLTAGSDTAASACNNYTPASLSADFTKQINQFGSLFPSALPIRTNRTHCIVWSDYDTQPAVALANGIRLDTNYYYWPGNWVNDVPGVFTGSGMPMRFAKADGTMIDVYQAATQMTDESGQSYPFTVDTLLDRALGAQGYYGAFVANMHTDTAVLAESQAIVASAQARGVPIVSARQMLDWLDGRNSSSFGAMTWSSNRLSFSVAVGTGGNGLQVMIPTRAGALNLTGITLNGVPVASTTQTIKGVQYAFVTVAPGQYQATYGP